MTIKLTQKNFNDFVEAFNHKMTVMKNDITWMKRIGYYMATMLTAITIKSIFFS